LYNKPIKQLNVLYCNLEKRVNNLLTKEELEKIKGEFNSIRELEKIKGDNNLSISRELEELKGEFNSIKELEIVNGELKIIKNNNNLCELRHQKNIKLKSPPNYLEYTLLYADFENCGICMYCPSEPYEPADTVLSGHIIDNNIYRNLKNILNN